METTKNAPFASKLPGLLAAYSEPLQVSEGITEPYVRALVCRYNTANNTTFGVFRVGGSLWLATRSDRRNIKPAAPEAQTTAPVNAPAAENLAPLELLQFAVEAMRGAGFGGSEMRAALENLLTENDDFL